MLGKKALLLITFVIGAYASIAARTIVVPVDFPTIDLALKNAENKDTVFVKAGKYYENIQLVEGVVLKGEDKRTTIIDGGRKGPVVTGADNATLRGFTIRNGKIAGVLCKNTGPIIKENIIADNKGSGVMAIMVLPEIKNNIIYDNTWSGIFCEGAKSLDTKISHNVIVKNNYSGVHLENGSSVELSSNIFVDNFEYAVFADESSARSRFGYNNIHKNYLSVNDNVVLDKTNISSDPKFINEKDWNYFVKEVSYSKKAGEDATDIGLIIEQEIVYVPTEGDVDGDGIMDSKDKCPNIPEDLDGFEDLDGCPDLDNDKDGIPDKEDACPNDPEDADGFEDHDGCPDLDNDKDGILDTEDACPNAPETINGFKDEDGCPDEKPKKIEKKLVLEGINFETGSSKIMQTSFAVLNILVDQLESFPEVRVEIGGHTDSKGQRSSNARLSLSRAKSVRQYLISKGIAEDRITAKGYGEDFPVGDNETEEGRAQNRRIEVKRLN